MLHSRIGTLSFVLVAISSSGSAAQLPACPKSAAAVARPCELDQWPLPELGRLAPQYPDILRHSGVSGEVRWRFVVDTNGRLLFDKIEWLHSTHDYFRAAVRSAFPLQRFQPPRRNGVATQVVVEELVTFAHGAPGWRTNRFQHLSRRSSDSTGRFLTTVYAFTPRDSANAPILTSADSVFIYDAVVDELTKSILVKKPPVTFCVQMDGKTPSTEMLERWRNIGRPVVTVANCPTTYTTMIAQPSDKPRPTGWIDPLYFVADSMLSWAENTVILRALTGQGTWRSIDKCEVVRVSGKWQAFCAHIQWSIS